MTVEKSTSFEEEYREAIKKIYFEIRDEYNGDVLSWVKSKLDMVIVGEDINKILLWLIMVSKDLDDPLHASIEGPSSVGKTTLVSGVSKAMPEDSMEILSRMTPAYLDYIKDRLKHKILWVQQMGGAESAQDTLHVMMTEKGLRLGTVKRGEGGVWETYYVEAEGPISFITTTVNSTRLDEQFRTRVWRLYPDDSPEQTKRIQEYNSMIAKMPWYTKQVEKELGKVALYVKHLQLNGVKKVVIPYSDKLLLDGKSVRLRRDHKKLLELIRVIAYVNQFFNHYIIEYEDEKYIVANKDDLLKALEIASEPLKQTIMDISKSEKKILEICRKIANDPNPEPGIGNVITARNVAKLSNGQFSQRTARLYLTT